MTDLDSLLMLVLAFCLGALFWVARRMRNLSKVQGVATHATPLLSAIYFASGLVQVVCGFFMLCTMFAGCAAGLSSIVFTVILAGVVAGGALSYFVIGERLEPRFNHWLESRVTRFSDDTLTDARTIAKSLPTAEPFNHGDYCRPDSMLLALDRNRQPIRVPRHLWCPTHVEVVGTTGAGKTSIAQSLLAQSVIMNDAVFVIDPKSDEWLPSVLEQVCEAHGVPFSYVDLTAPHPQMNLFHGIDSRDLAALLIEGFELERRHLPSDYYMLFERMAAGIIAELAGYKAVSVADCARSALGLLKVYGLDKTAQGFVYSLRELNGIIAFATRGGARLHEPLARGGVFYVRGSLEHDATINAQKMLLLRIMQIVRARPRTAGRHVVVFMDDARFVVGKAASRMLATIRDRNCNVILAHTSMSDLGDERQAITDNTGLKLCFRAHTPESADFMSRLGGNIIARTRRVQTVPNSAGHELQLGAGMAQEVERPWIDTNTALHLPDRVCAIYGLGTAQLGGNCPILVERREPSIRLAAKPASEGTRLVEATQVLQ